MKGIGREEHELHNADGSHKKPDPRWSAARKDRHERLLREHMAGYNTWIATPDYVDEGQGQGADAEEAEEDLDDLFQPRHGEAQPLPVSEALKKFYDQGLPLRGADD